MDSSWRSWPCAGVVGPPGIGKSRIITEVAKIAAQHPSVGEVRGLGVFWAIELVRDRESLEPATAECYAICDRLRELGVVVQPTGERANVLKMKPPMCLTAESADFVMECLETVLRDGW